MDLKGGTLLLCGYASTELSGGLDSAKASFTAGVKVQVEEVDTLAASTPFIFFFSLGNQRKVEQNTGGTGTTYCAGGHVGAKESHQDCMKG